MCYLTSDFRTLSEPRTLKKKKEASSHGTFSASIKNPEPLLYNLKTSKKESLYQELRKTAPLILFVNLLMKDGKKSHALRILSMTLFLFKAKISKIQLEKNSGSLKERSKNFHQYLLDSFRVPWQSAYSKNFISNYAIKAGKFNVVFSLKSSRKPNQKQTNTQTKVPCQNKQGTYEYIESKAGLLKYKKLFPFIIDFYSLFDDFYAKQKFFCGKFLNLTPKKIIKKSNSKNKKAKNRTKTKTKESLGIDSKPLVLERDMGNSNGYLVSKESNTPAFIANPFQFKFTLDHKKRSWTKVKKESISYLSSLSKKCLWYKTLAKKPSWDKLTSSQKSTFLYCLYKAISNIKPPLECRTKRIGGSNKQIPSQVSEHRQWGIAIRWIIEAAQNEFSKKKNKNPVSLHKDFFKANLDYIPETFGNAVGSHAFPKGVASHFGPWAVKEKKMFISSLLQKKSKDVPLKEHCPKTKFYYFCFFLAESLENAYYKRGPAMQKRNLWVDTALANRAFLRYRWW